MAEVRGSNGFSGNRITYQDIGFWSALTGTLIRPTEVRALVLIDRAWMAEQVRQEQARQAAERARRRTAQRPD